MRFVAVMWEMFVRCGIRGLVARNFRLICCVTSFWLEMSDWEDNFPLGIDHEQDFLGEILSIRSGAVTMFPIQSPPRSRFPAVCHWPLCLVARVEVPVRHGSRRIRIPDRCDLCLVFFGHAVEWCV